MTAAEPQAVRDHSTSTQPRRLVEFLERVAVRAAWVYLVGFCLGVTMDWGVDSVPGIAAFWDAWVPWSARIIFRDTRPPGVFVDEGGYSGRYEHYRAATAL